MLADEVACKNILHIAGKECEVIKTIQFCIYARIDDSILDILHTDNLLGITCNKVGNCSGTGIKVIHHLIARERRKLARNLIKIIGLFAVRLVERLRTNLKAQALHLLINDIGTLISNHLKVAERIVALVVYHIEQRGNLGELLRYIL